MTSTELAALLAALGCGAILPQLIQGVIGWITGRQDVERRRYQQIIEERDRAERDADREASMRRRISEHASYLRQLLIQSGYPSQNIPEWPIPPRHLREQETHHD